MENAAVRLVISRISFLSNRTGRPMDNPIRNAIAIRDSAARDEISALVLDKLRRFVVPAVG
jgi:hypothetical protein